MRTRLLFIACLFIFWGQSQTESAPDSSVVIKKKQRTHSPKLASLLSAVIPGSGQIYNRKYWKAPIIYVALGGLGYWFVNNQTQYSYYRKNLIAEADGDPNTINQTNYSQDQLQVQKLQYRKYRDLSGVCILAVYALNIIDANVDAHLRTFDVSDDLSMNLNLKPVTTFNSNAALVISPGISLKLKFK